MEVYFPQNCFDSNQERHAMNHEPDLPTDAEGALAFLATLALKDQDDSRCRYPTCSEPRRLASTGTGRPSAYCENPEHIAVSNCMILLLHGSSKLLMMRRKGGQRRDAKQKGQRGFPLLLLLETGKPLQGDRTLVLL